MAQVKQIKVSEFNSRSLLQLGLGVFFFIIGLFGILPSVQESIFSLTDSNLPLELVFGLIEMGCGIILLTGLFLYGQRKLLALAALIVFIFWAARIFISQFVFGFAMKNGAFYFYGGFEQWLITLIVELIILISIWNIRERYAR